MKIKTFANAPKFTKLQELAIVIQTGADEDVRQALATLKADPAFAGEGWQASFAKLQTVVATKRPAFSVFKMDGNSKLPFVAFSTLPGVTCSGAGDCLTYCYSYRAWRYPAAFARQAQNAYLMRFAQSAIVEAWEAVNRAMPEEFDFRLYVDGDFASVADVDFWMTQIDRFPMVKAYGYSKSFSELLQFDAIGKGVLWPSNYLLNISSGHAHNDATVEAIKALPITRGEFKAVKVDYKVTSAMHGTSAHNAALRAAYGQKAFTCPGQCGSCTNAGHACGAERFKGVDIIIAVH